MSRVTVSLNGIDLQTVSPYIILQEVNEGRPQISYTAASGASGIGQFVTQKQRQYVDINVKFSILLMKGAEMLRADILNAVNEWAAAGGALSVSYRPNVHIDVVMFQQMTVGNVKKFNSDYQITFRAYDVPYWVDDSPTTVTGRTATLQLSGNAPSLLNARIVNDGNSATTKIKIAVGQKFIELDGISIAKNASVEITHNGSIMTIKSGETSLLAKRTKESADDLWLNPGTNQITCTSTGGSCSFTLYAFGRWM